MAERALRASERKKILVRDNFTSQMRHYDEKRGFHTGCEDCPKPKKQTLNVHHIDPNGNGGSNTPRNLITVFECEHTGKRCDGSLADPKKKFVVHPDMVKGFKEYRKGNKKAISEVMDRRKPLKAKKEVYWNTGHDEEMRETAEERTLNAITKGWKWKK